MWCRGSILVVVSLMCALVIVLAGGCGKKPQSGETAGPPPKPPNMMPQMPTAQTGGLSGKKVVMVIAPEGFRDEEYSIPKQALTDAGAAVTTASLQAGECRGAGGATVQAEKAVSDIEALDYDAIIFVGGPGMVQYLNDASLIGLAKQFKEAGRLIAAICVAPTILANAGLLSGVEATVWTDNRGDLQAKGAKVSDKDVVTSGKIVTANGPEAANEFADAVVAALQTAPTP